MFPYTISDRGITLFIDGMPRLFSNTHPSFSAIMKAVDEDNQDVIRGLCDVRREVIKMTLGRVKIMDNTILVADREVSGKLTDRILEMVSRGSKTVDGLIKFLDKLMSNPSPTAINELYLFIEACDLPITSNGNFLAYKRVRADYTDCHSGTISNKVGETPWMQREEVDPVRDNLCSTGLHFCSYGYLPHFGNSAGNKVMVVEINPADVVSIPSDYDNSKGRCWTYRVVGEIDNWEQERITSWYSNEYDKDTDYDHEVIGDDNDEEDEFELEYSDEDDGYGLDEDDGYGLDEDDGYGLDEEDPDMPVDVPAPINTLMAGHPIQTPAQDSQKSYRGKKLDANDVRSIRKLLGKKESYSSVGRKFEVHRETIARIDRGDIWAWVK
jgi:hypothetical protein